MWNIWEKSKNTAILKSSVAMETAKIYNIY